MLQNIFLLPVNWSIIFSKTHFIFSKPFSVTSSLSIIFSKHISVTNNLSSEVTKNCVIKKEVTIFCIGNCLLFGVCVTPAKVSPPLHYILPLTNRTKQAGAELWLVKPLFTHGTLGARSNRVNDMLIWWAAAANLVPTYVTPNLCWGWVGLSQLFP